MDVLGTYSEFTSPIMYIWKVIQPYIWGSGATTPNNEKYTTRMVSSVTRLYNQQDFKSSKKQPTHSADLFFKQVYNEQNEECDNVGTRPYLAVLLPQGQRYFLIDTGSVANLISDKLIREYERKAGPLTREPAEVNLIAQNNSSLNISYKVNLTIALSSNTGITTVQVPFYVTNTDSDEGILGTNFLKYISANIVYHKNGARLNYVATSSENTTQPTIVELLEGVIVQPHQNIVAHAIIRLNSSDNKKIDPIENSQLGKYKRQQVLLRAALPGPTQALAKFGNVTMPFMIQNNTDNTIQYPKGTLVGTVELLPQGYETIPLSNMFSSIRTYSLVKLKNAFNCFCKRASSVHTIYKVFFLKTETETNFRNKSTLSLHQDYEPQNLPFLIRGDDIYIGPRLGKITKQDIEALMMNLANDAHYLICVTDYGELTVPEHDIVGFMSNFSNNITIEYFKKFAKMQNALCDIHKPNNYDTTDSDTEYKIILLAGGHLPPIEGTSLTNFELADTKIDAYKSIDTINDKTLITLAVHAPEMRLTKESYLHSLFQQLIYDIVRSDNNKANKIKISLRTTATTVGYTEINRVLRKIDIHKSVDIQNSQILNISSTVFKKRENCPCATCQLDNNPSTIKEYILTCSQIKNEKYISEVDVEEDYRMPTNDEVEDDNYSIVTNLNEKVNTPEVYSDPPEVADETDLKQIYEGCPDADKPFYEELFDMFKFLFTADNTKIRVIRDRRVAVPLKFKGDVPKTKQVFPASAPMATRIQHIFTNLALKGIAQEVDEAQFVSPTFLRVRSRADLETLKRDPTANVKTRLISSYVKLNKYVEDIPTQLPVIKEMITSLSSYQFLGTADLQQAYRSFPLEEEATEYLALSAPSGKVFKILILVEGVTNAVRFADRAISDSLVFCDPTEKDKQIPKSNTPWITDLSTLREALDRPNNGDMPESRTREAISWNELPLKHKEMTIEKTRIKMEKEFKTPQIIRLAEVSHTVRADSKCTTNFLDDLYIYAMTTDGFKRAITSLLIDSSNHGYLYNVKKFRPFSIINGKGTCKILGFEMTDRTIKPLQNENNPISKLEYPTTVRGLMRCLGTLQYLAPYMHSLTPLTASFYEMISKKTLATKIELSRDQKVIFDMLKNRATNLKALYLPLATDALILTTDASHNAVGACLSAITDKNEIKTVSYFSKLLPASNRNKGGSLYKEAIALALSLYYFRFYVYSNPCCVLTDASALVALIVYSKTKNSILQRLATRISSYPIDYIYHIAGDDNVTADILSRLPKFKLETPELILRTKIQDLTKDKVYTDFLPQRQKMPFSELEGRTVENMDKILPGLDLTEQCELPDVELPGQDGCVAALHNAAITHIQGLGRMFKLSKCTSKSDDPFPPPRFPKQVISAVNINPTGMLTLDFLNELQMRDHTMSQQIKTLQSNDYIPKHLRKYSLREGRILVGPGPLGDRIRCTKEMVARILVQLHLLGHLSIKKVIKVFSRYFSTGSNIREIAKSVVKACHRCNRFKPLQHHDYVQGRVHRGSEPLSHLVMDHIVMQKTYFANGKAIKYILSVCDTFSGFIFAFPQTNITNASVKRDLLSIKAIFGFHPQMSITCDNSTSFKSTEMTDFFEQNGIHVHYVLPYSSQSAGIIENRNRQIRQILALEMNDDKHFTNALANAIYYLNIRPTASSILSPYELFFGKAKFSFLNFNKDKLVENAIANEQYLIYTTNPKPSAPREHIIPGDMIRIRASFTGVVDKQDEKYLDKIYEVVKRKPHQITYRDPEDVEGKLFECHIKYVKKCNPPNDPLLDHITSEQREVLLGSALKAEKGWKQTDTNDQEKDEADAHSMLAAPPTEYLENNTNSHSTTMLKRVMDPTKDVADLAVNIMKPDTINRNQKREKQIKTRSDRALELSNEARKRKSRNPYHSEVERKYELRQRGKYDYAHINKYGRNQDKPTN